MKLTIVVVGRPGALLAEAIADYEQRAARYWTMEISEVKAEKASRGKTEKDVQDAEGERLLARVPPDSQIVALTRQGGDAWSSARLARLLEERALHAGPDLTFLIGGAFGLSEEVLRVAERRMRLSAFTLTHDIARLILAEQLYRVGTIVRGEPYHKGRV
ncbi:MAG: 23S rRNA (pseudouridine(1915)-N(3))-methyltransferase RlmH [Gemmatimonadota bacterium]|jgi:23S rRNA (pseudouridine1915-N3)-methyltransferase